MRALDVTDTRRMRHVVAEAFADLGRVDVVVSNAGFGVFGAAEDLTDGQFHFILDDPAAARGVMTASRPDR